MSKVEGKMSKVEGKMSVKETKKECACDRLLHVLVVCAYEFLIARV